MPSPLKQLDPQVEPQESTASPSSMVVYPEHNHIPQRLSSLSSYEVRSMPAYPHYPQQTPSSYQGQQDYYDDGTVEYSANIHYTQYPNQYWTSTNVHSFPTGMPGLETNPVNNENTIGPYRQSPYTGGSNWNGTLLPASQSPYNATSSVDSSTYLYHQSSYPIPQYHPQANGVSPAGSSELVPSPLSGTRLSPHVSPPTTPQSLNNSVTGEDEGSLVAPVVQDNTNTEARLNRPLYSHREQLQFFREALALPTSPMAGPFIPQPMYKPHTNSDRRRYVEEVDLDPPIYFWSENPDECGISLADALHSRVRRLRNRDETVFEGRGPSVSIRLEWPGYRQWSRQIPTRDFRSPPGPITKAKLAKNVAKCVQRFISERQGHPLEDDSDARWRIGSGTGTNYIRFEDLILVSIHHVSMGSWQPQLRLSRPFPGVSEGY